MNKLYKISVVLTRFFMKYVWRYEVVHKERLLEAKGVIFVANHISWFDPPFIGSIIPFEIAYLAKEELFFPIFFGNILRKLNAIPVNRRGADIKAVTSVIKVLDSGKSLLLFPEGTARRRKKTGAKPGVGLLAIKAQRDILPIYIENSDEHLSTILSPKKKIRIVIGEKIKYEHFAEWEANKENYQKLADYAFSKIMELKSEN